MNAAFGVRFAFLGDLAMPSFALLSVGRQEGSPQQPSGPGRIHEDRQGAKGFEDLSVWFGPEAGVLVVWRVERLWPCQDGQGQRGFRLSEV
jgi:hypothetical protein